MKYFGRFIICLILVSCSSAPLQFEKAKELEDISEFDKAVKVEEATSTTGPAPVPETSIAVPKATPSESEKALVPSPKATPVAVKGSVKKAKKVQKQEEPKVAAGRQPELEDDTGFQGRRPLKDPFRVGEVITHNVHYFKISAGTLKLKVEPMVNVNGRKAFNFATEIKTGSMYSRIYSVDDRVETFVDYETLVPRTYSLHVKETGQLREARMLFDEKLGRATFWEKKVTEKSGVEEKKKEWDILPYSQNVFSAIFYMRNFQWAPGKEIAFRVADDGQNLVFKGRCLRREKIDTEIGERTALVIKPEITLQGKFKPVGDIYIWLSDDEYKYPLRIESKIKIGTLVSEVTSIIPGHN